MLVEHSSNTVVDRSQRIIVSRAKIAIGGLTLEIEPGTNLDGLQLYGVHQPFMVETSASDTLLRAHVLPIPEESWGECVFVSGGLWSLYRRGDEYVIPFISPLTAPRPYRLAVFNSDFSRGDLYVPPTDPHLVKDAPELGPGSVALDPLMPPIDELIVINLLNRESGLYIHACGLCDDKRAIAFCGVSGAGKSTMARLWRGQPFTILSDDRLIVRPDGPAYHVWGTPWHGDADNAEPIGRTLAKLYFLEQSPENRITPLSPVEAARRLLVRCFPTFYDAAGMSATLDLVARVCSTVPCAELAFAPDSRVVDLVTSDAFTA